jgi:C4-dicarboxylate-specific signal transduction histidine kinase
MHPGTQLVVAIGLFMVVVLPVLSWLSLGNRRSLKVLLWYGGLAGIAVATLAVSALQRANWFSASTLAVGFGLFWWVLQLERQQAPSHWRPYAAGLLAYVALEGFIDLIGVRQPWGVLLTTSTLAILQGAVLLALVRLQRMRQSRGLVLVIIGVVLVASVNLLRALRIVVEGASPTLFSYSWQTNAAILSIVTCSVLMNFGYLLFVLEKSHRRQLAEAERLARTEAESALARQHAAELQQVVGQRDEMLLASSRFSAMNTLTMFHAAIVHELSQPLQSLTSILDKVEMRVANAEPGLRQDVANAHQVLRQMAGSLASLRQLIASKEIRLEPVFLLPLMEEVSSIVENEAHRRAILFDFHLESAQGARTVQADKVLLHRIVMNLVTNAFEAHAQSGPAAAGPRMVRLIVGQRQVNGAAMASVRVEDNGPGFDPELLARVGHQFATSKVQGVGMGLVLARVMVESWGGQLQVRNRRSASGAQVELLLAAA